eukprot:TRINITY_DN1249_c0_g1_i2.p1 TRINITY_DN1249_c0_g1~~TRINITY_DN1249_c0_g1_i2.p1  ORF type:complete len:184 (-),score=62.45 TRINITY_DN1249_c0_g1_i2:166-687(-)
MVVMDAFILSRPEEKVSGEELASLGVLHWKLDADNFEQEGKLGEICKERGYTYKDFVDSTKMPNLREKLNNFMEEHIHDDEEIRFCVDGTGFFDVRSRKEEWVRIVLRKGDMIILPAGIYHRFVPDEANLYFKVMRLFVGEPVWTPYNRIDSATDSRPARKLYVESFLGKKQS